jgi:hypothetical protein
LSKPEKDIAGKKNYRLIPFLNKDAKILNRMLPPNPVLQ